MIAKIFIQFTTSNEIVFEQKGIFHNYLLDSHCFVW